MLKRDHGPPRGAPHRLSMAAKLVHRSGQALIDPASPLTELARLT